MPKIRQPNRSSMGTGVYWESMSHWERGLLTWALEIAQGNYDRAATILGVTKGHVFNRCKVLDIDVKAFSVSKDKPQLKVVDGKKGKREEPVEDSDEDTGPEDEAEDIEGDVDEEDLDDLGDTSLDDPDEESEEDGDREADEDLPDEEPPSAA